MQHICVFAGSNYGNRPEYRQAAQALGQELVARGLGLVYGGASVGLMGVIADSVLARGGEVIGVIPRGLFKREFPHSGLTQLHEVGSMHERKALMADLADGFIALPGGFGTFDELFEITNELTLRAKDGTRHRGWQAGARGVFSRTQAITHADAPHHGSRRTVEDVQVDG